MADLTNFIGKAQPLTDTQIPQIGSLIGVGEDELHAFMDVEAAGDPFDSQGRPKMLYEGAQFYKNLSGQERDKAVVKGLAWRTWDPKGHPYPRDSYPTLRQAMAINRAAALCACSWGLTQILAVNHVDAGYESPEEMVLDFQDSAAAQLEATVKCLIAWKIDDDLRAHRWQVVARVWNGPRYAENKYDQRLESRYNWWAKIPDTPWEGELKGNVVVVHSTVRRGSKGDDVRALQQMLSSIGYPLEPDGIFGSATEGAVKKFQARSKLSVDGIVGQQTWTVLISKSSM